MRMLPLLAITLGLGLVACGDSDSGDGDEGSAAQEPGVTTTEGAGDRYPSVLRVTAEATGEGTFTFSVTISSPYDSPERYADGWRILTPDGEQIAEHELTHDHASEQPFTREQSGVEVSPELTEVVVEGRDSKNGYGGKRERVALPRL
jgi:hypothetical protein